MAKIFVLSAASGAGKTTLKDLVLPEFSNLKYSISATTRSPRMGEQDGKDYFFVNKAHFEKMIANQELAEYNEVHGNYYGTPKSFIDKHLHQNIHILLDLDVFGKPAFDLAYPEAIGILILPPNDNTLEERLRQRGTDSEEVIQLRLANAQKENTYALQHGKYEHTIVNNDLHTAAKELKLIITQEMENN
jgi:guanylate kinase